MVISMLVLFDFIGIIIYIPCQKILMEKSNLKLQLENLAKAFNQRYISKNLSLEPLSIMGGKLGLAVFAAYYYEVEKNQAFLDFAVSTIEECFEYISTQEIVSDTFASGASGVAWVVKHFMEKGWVEADEDTLLQFDDYLENVGLAYFQRGYYDYLHGGIGVALYWLERESGEKHLREMLHLFKEKAVQNEQGTHWINPNLGLWYRDNIVKNEVNFSLSHGMTSIIYILTKVHERGIEAELCEELLQGVIQFIQQYPSKEEDMSYFPSSLEIDDNGDYIQSSPSRLAWCYGDLGMSVVLMQAGLRLKDENILNLAKKVGQKTLQRKTMKDSLLKDGGFCHGIFGVAFCYDKLFEYSKAPEFLEAANHWFAIGEDYLNNQQALDQYYSPDNGEDEVDDSLLTGSMGIGLVLMDQLGLIRKTKDQRHWDRILLLS